MATLEANTMVQVITALPPEIGVLIRGPHGIGKSAIVKSVAADLGLEVIDVRASTMQEGDVVGYPDLEAIKTTGRSTFALPAWFVAACEGPVVLFLDELGEFHPSALDALRQPLEEGVVRVSRAQRAVTYPADFLLVGAMNPCPCGYWGDKFRDCTCAPSAVQKYQKRISGPLLDRIDLRVEVPCLPPEDLAMAPQGETTAQAAARIQVYGRLAAVLVLTIITFAVITFD